MGWLAYLFDYPDESLLLYGRYDTWLVVLSVVVAIFTSSMALHIATQARKGRSRSRRVPVLLAGSIALGGGVWSMHFIGMLAFDLCTPVSYDRGVTLLSMVPSVAAALLAVERGARIVRVHDVKETVAALAVWRAAHGMQTQQQEGFSR